MTRSKIFLLFCLTIFLSACSAGTVKPFLKSQQLQAENLPTRTLRVLAVTDGSHRETKIIEFMDRCSQLVEQQIGIRLEVVGWKDVQWDTKFSALRMLKNVVDKTWNDRDQFDLAVAFTGLTLHGDGIMLALGAGTWLGMIDDTYRRFVILKVLDPYVLLHELFHAFIFSEAHSQKCIMTTGFYPIGKNCLWLSLKDRREVLGNKQRDFNVKPKVEGGTDFIEEPEDRVPNEGMVVEKYDFPSLW